MNVIAGNIVDHDELEKKSMARTDETVLEALERHKIPVASSCGGMGTCGTCKIDVLSSVDKLEARNEVEAEFAQARSYAPSERLACQIHWVKGLKISVPAQ